MNSQIRSFCFRLLVLLVPLTFSHAAIAGTSSGLHSIKLLSQQVGFAANSDDLFWTTDAGTHWEKRTPPNSTEESIEDVFFLNTSVGWVLLARGDENDQAQFDLASTEDSGTTWRVSHVEIPNRMADDFSGRGWVFFLDRLHGWMNLAINSGSAFRPGTMLSTRDGGTTWRYAAGQPGVAGSFCFFNAQDGILSGGPENTELHITHDGSTSWQEISLKAAQVSPADFPTYSAPTCDGKNGFVPITFSGREGIKSALVLFATSNAGHEFRLDRVLSNLDETSPGQEITTALADSQLIALGASNKNSLFMTTVPRSGNHTSATFHVGGAPFAVLKASFAGPLQGWALTSSGLFLTTDGGGTWTDITPTRIGRPTSVGPAVDSEPAEPAATSQGSNGARLLDQSNASAVVSKNTRVGFDKGFVPLTAQMNTWWKFSPYFESGLYIPGAVNKKKDINLNSTWVSTVIGYGWGLIPIWVGPQAPCVYQTGLALISATNPYAQGQAEAGKAIAAAKNLSSSLGPVIYYNMENYNTSDSGCRAIVTGFLNGWVNAMQSNGYKAGVYGNAAPAALDFSQLNPLPDDVWITKTALAPNAPIVSIWGLKPLCDYFSKTACTVPLWYNSQRIHQYLINHAETWGGLALKVDRDVVDADVAVSSTGSKAYSFNYTSIDYPGAAYTLAYGINNAGDVGGVYGSGAELNGFVYSKSKDTYTSFAFPSAAVNAVIGINDSDQVAGYYVDNQGNFISFTYISGKFATFSVGDWAAKAAMDINDDGQIVGAYISNGLFEGFLKNRNSGALTIFPIGSPGSESDGLDGDNYVVSSGTNGSGALYNPVLGTSVPFNLPSYSYPLGVNDSLQVVGSTLAGFLLYDYPSNTQTSLQYPGSGNSSASGINDYSVIVGNWTDSKGVNHGFIANPSQ
jgi:photosystem II stability/assembly factor-like uncharacterized protein